MKIASNVRLSIMAGTHFFLMRKPMATAFTNAGRKSKPIKLTGLPSAIAKNVPINTLAPPVYGPKTIPYIGARLSETENVVDRPIIGPMGICLITE